MMIPAWLSFFIGVVAGFLVTASAIIGAIVVVSFVAYRRVQRGKRALAIDQQMRAAAQRAAAEDAPTTSAGR